MQVMAERNSEKIFSNNQYKEIAQEIVQSCGKGLLLANSKKWSTANFIQKCKESRIEVDLGKFMWITPSLERELNKYTFVNQNGIKYEIKQHISDLFSEIVEWKIFINESERFLTEADCSELSDDLSPYKACNVWEALEAGREYMIFFKRNKIDVKLTLGAFNVNEVPVDS